MPRLIDADALMAEFAEFVRPANNSDFAPVPTWNDAVSLLGSAPTIEERKKGKWNCSDDMYESGVCSVCEWDTGESYVNCKKWFKYCPNCGARMER